MNPDHWKSRNEHNRVRVLSITCLGKGRYLSSIIEHLKSHIGPSFRASLDCLKNTYINLTIGTYEAQIISCNRGTNNFYRYLFWNCAIVPSWLIEICILIHHVALNSHCGWCDSRARAWTETIVTIAPMYLAKGIIRRCRIIPHRLTSCVIRVYKPLCPIDTSHCVPVRSSIFKLIVLRICYIVSCLIYQICFGIWTSIKKPRSTISQKPSNLRSIWSYFVFVHDPNITVIADTETISLDISIPIAHIPSNYCVIIVVSGVESNTVIVPTRIELRREACKEHISTSV